MTQTLPQQECIDAGCEHGVQRCSQPQIDCDSYACSFFAMAAGITTKRPKPHVFESRTPTKAELERVRKLVIWIERDRRESDKVIAYTLELRGILGDPAEPTD